MSDESSGIPDRIYDPNRPGPSDFMEKQVAQAPLVAVMADGEGGDRHLETSFAHRSTDRVIVSEEIGEALEPSNVIECLAFKSYRGAEAGLRQPVRDGDDNTREKMQIDRQSRKLGPEPFPA